MASLVWLLLTTPLPATAQSTDTDHAQHHPKEAKPSKVKGPLDPLEKALEKSAPKTSLKKKNSQMSQGQKKSSMKMNSSQGKGGMGGMADMMGMMGQMMGQMAPPQTGNSPSSELPGFPGASHIYHIGATGYFVDHEDMLDLTKDQLRALNQIKEKSLLAQSSYDRKIEQGEEDLWMLTASDRPDIKSIEAKVKEIEAIKGEQRIKFIRDVGEAASLLTPQQRSVLLGNTSSPPENPSSGKSPMGDM